MKFVKTTLEIFKVTVEKDGKTQEYFFTNAEKPVTYEGQQYIPLSGIDQAKWLKDEINS